jgi:hypothetical protein
MEADYFSPAGYTLRAGVQATYHRFGDIPIDGFQTDGSVYSGGNRFLAVPARLGEFAAYIENTWHIAPRFRVQPGLRLSRFGTDNNIDILPRFNLRYDIDPDRFILKAGFGRQIQYVHQIQDQSLQTSFHTPARWIPATSDQIDPATGFQANIGVESRPLRGFELRADAYWRSYSGVLIPSGYDLVNLSTENPRSQVEWVQAPAFAGRQRGVGVEISASYRASGWVLWTSYVGQRAAEETTTSTGRLASVPARLSIPHSVRIGTSWTNGSWALALIGEVRNGYPVAVASSEPGVIVSESISSETAIRTGSWDRLPVYGRLDATIGYRFPLLGAGWLAQVDVFNLTNRSNIIGHLYEPGVVIPARSDLKGLPRLPLFKLRVEF